MLVLFGNLLIFSLKLRSGPQHFSLSSLDMWRNSSKLLTSSNHIIPKSTFVFSGISPPSYGFERTLSHSQFYSTTSTSAPSTDAAMKLGFPKLDKVRFASSSAAIDATPFAAAIDLARHYGRCYWELSKARLRLGFGGVELFVFDFVDFSLGFDSLVSG